MKNKTSAFLQATDSWTLHSALGSAIEMGKTPAQGDEDTVVIKKLVLCADILLIGI